VLLGWLILTAQMKPTNITVTKYAQQADELEQAISAIPAELIARRPSESRWSVLEIVCHLADAELLASVRIRRIITQDRPNLWGYKQELWAATLGYGHRRIETATARFALLRRENAELLAELPESLPEGLPESLPESQNAEVWHHTGVHDQYGTLSLWQLIEDYLSHTEKHLDQIKNVAADVANGNNG
jgi:hypothetical protein